MARGLRSRVLAETGRGSVVSRCAVTSSLFPAAWGGWVEARPPPTDLVLKPTVHPEVAPAREGRGGEGSGPGSGGQVAP